jgi:hypothetical protein
MVRWCGPPVWTGANAGRAAFALSLLIRVNPRLHFLAPERHTRTRLAKECQAGKRRRRVRRIAVLVSVVWSRVNVQPSERSDRLKKESNTEEERRATGVGAARTPVALRGPPRFLRVEILASFRWHSPFTRLPRIGCPSKFRRGLRGFVALVAQSAHGVPRRKQMALRAGRFGRCARVRREAPK